jgi:spore maturation protein CgeB
MIFYDGDVPLSLPEYGGADTGFNIYRGADPGEYDLVISNSEGGRTRIEELGARRTATVFWAADPELFAPQQVAKEHDVFFYGYGEKYRAEWIRDLVAEPSRLLPDAAFALGGPDFRGDVGRARLIGDVPYNAFPGAISASRINLNITRRSHATVPGSSTARPFELAATGAAIVSNPVAGIEQWFEPGRELIVVSSADEAVDTYRGLLGDPAEAAAMGARARERVLDEHTYAHRASQLLELISAVGAPVPAAASVSG